MAFRPCIDIKDGLVVQIVGGTLSGQSTLINHISQKSARSFAALYRQDGLRGGHVILLSKGSEKAAREALQEYPGGLQVGGGVNDQNALSWLDAGASHIIVTSWLFPEGQFQPDRLQRLSALVGQEHLVVDLSCRRMPDGSYHVATDRWQTITPRALSKEMIQRFEASCAELLIHAADVEGRCSGIDADLVERLGEWVSVPTTYAGGARSLDDIQRVENLSGGTVDLTIGSALDIFGGSLVRYEDAARFGIR